jgi:CRISPR system Cascade subunit CasD
VIGLVCAALGRPRTEPVDDLAALKFGVRVDHPGSVKRDFHTVTGIAKASGGTAKYPLVTERFYLADADFLVGFEGPDLEQLRDIETAVRAPHWQIFLGRKAFVPACPVALPWGDGHRGGIREGQGLGEALRNETWPRPDALIHPTERGRLRLVIETADPNRAERRIDQPAPGAAFAERRFLPRYVVTSFVDVIYQQTGEASNG